MAVIDCDYPQHSIVRHRNRDVELIQTDVLRTQFLRQGRPAYPVMAATSADCMDTFAQLVGDEGSRLDIILFDFPGTVNSEGVLSALMQMDYLLIPMRADRVVLESTLNFATTIHDQLITTGIASIRGMYLFWNMVDRRERNRLYELYEDGITRLGLQCLKTRLPVRANFTKDPSAQDGPVYRSTLLPPDVSFARESGFEALMDELSILMELNGHAQENFGD